MKVLIADDHDTNRRLLQAVLTAEGYVVLEARDGAEAMELLTHVREPLVALLDWQMPRLQGPEVCRQARSLPHEQFQFLILLTVRDDQEGVVEGLKAGANDYVRKPFDTAELLARVAIGARMVSLQWDLAERLTELKQALTEVKQLSGLLPICSYCKRIRDDANYWQQVESFISAHSDARFSHGVCPSCFDVHLKPELNGLGLKMAYPTCERHAPKGT